MPVPPSQTAQAEAPHCAGFDPVPQAPGFALPSGACDCHLHIFCGAAGYPWTPGRSYTPPEAPLSAFLHQQSVLGLERAVIVQPSVYGTDNRATLDAVAAGGSGFRAVVVVGTDISLAELETLHAKGARGIRINPLFDPAASMDGLNALGGKLAELGWHIQILVDVSQVDGLEALAGGLPVPVVFDHMGHVPAGQALCDPGFRALLRLLEAGRAWVKLSGAYRITGEQAAPYGDVAPVARALAAANPENLVWGSDWPHPQIPVPMPNDGPLLDMLADWIPDNATRNRILADNPARLYGFA